MSAGASQPGEVRLGERVAILVNPTAGRGRAAHLADALEAACRGRGASVWRQATQRAGDGVRLARELPDDIARVFVLGGDGTLREVAAGVLERAQRPALGHIPLGNANVVAREMGIPLQGEAALAALLDGELRTIDILRVGEQVVLAMVGVGYDAETARAMERVRSGPLRRWY
ncbi:MAG TPA: acylglycerol kinase family protein, partial [Planctomycetota bacterium]|nr:acylglycerol kinase family protein [Planctomycetota bacterium]